jgi:hypothetical protein
LINKSEDDQVKAPYRKVEQAVCKGQENGDQTFAPRVHPFMPEIADEYLQSDDNQVNSRNFPVHPRALLPIAFTKIEPIHIRSTNKC